MSRKPVSIFDCSRISITKRTLIAFSIGPRLLWSPTRIRRDLQKRGFQFLPSLAAISLFCKRFRSSGNISDAVGRGRKPVWTASVSATLDRWIEADREVTMQALRQRLQKTYGLRCSREAVRQQIVKIGWRKTQTRYCQMVRHVNRVKRLVFCMQCIKSDEQFDDVVFTDEASVELCSNGLLRFRRIDEPAVNSKVGKPKHPLKVHVWAGISKRGATSICIFRGIMNSKGYQRILDHHLIPFGRLAYPEGYRLMQDNDPKHVSNATKAYFKENGINHWHTPPESPDLNPIEMMWSLLKRFLSKNIKPKSKDALIRGISEFWKTVTPELCVSLINHLKKVIPVVVLRNGSASGY